MSFAPLPTIVPLHACETVSGRYVDVVDPKPEDIVIEDIAWSLSRQVRYAGHTLGDPYHIAQHACFVEFLLDYVTSEDSIGDPLRTSFNGWMNDAVLPIDSANRALLLMHALCHDNTEAYLVDLPSPVKRHPALRDPYKALESNLHEVILEALGVGRCNAAHNHAIVWADLMALQIEAANLMPSRGRGWAGNLPYFELRFMSLMPKILNWNAANDQFLQRFRYLKEQLAVGVA
jgi:hypothetical protein